MKVKLVGKMIQSDHLCFLRHGFLTWFLILGKIQHCGTWVATIVDNVIGLQQLHHAPIIYTSSTEGKIVSKYCKISKTLGKAPACQV